MPGRHQSGRIYYTLADLKTALDAFLEASPEQSDRPFGMECAGECGWTTWNGTFYEGVTCVTLEDVKDEFAFDPEAVVDENGQLSEAMQPDRSSWPFVQVEIKSHIDYSARWGSESSDTREVYTGVRAEIDPESRYGTQMPVKRGDTVWVVVAHYDSGDTFGRHQGLTQVVGFYNNSQKAGELLTACEEFEKARGEYERASWSLRMGKASERPKVVPNLRFEGEDVYTSWTGYFESLNNFDLVTAVIQ